MNDSFSTFERRLVGPYRAAFARVTAPLVRLLVWLRVPPNAVSGSQIAIGIVIVFVFESYPQLAFVLFLSTLMLDSLDGALARAYGRTSQFGALVDQLSDHTRETLMIAAMALHGALYVVAAVLYPLVYAVFNFTLFLCNFKQAPIPWALKSYLVVYPAFFLYAFFGLNWLTAAVTLSIALMATSILLGLRNLSQVMN